MSDWKLIYKPLIIFPGIPLLMLLAGPIGVAAAFFYCLLWSELGAG